jgi:hypothetical protein
MGGCDQRFLKIFRVASSAFTPQRELVLTSANNHEDRRTNGVWRYQIYKFFLP